MPPAAPLGTADPALPFHTRAVIISSGDEIILGQLLDTNAQRIARTLTGRGVLPIEHISVPDDLPALVAALERAARSAPLVILSGGLGPTDGDLSRAALAALTGDALVLDPDARVAIAALLAARNREMTPRQERQAYRPSRATSLPNPFGTAPGLYLQLPLPEGGGRGVGSFAAQSSTSQQPQIHASPVPHTLTDIFALPGPPGELNPMLEREVLPRLRTDPARSILTQLAHIVGIPEADCVTKLGDLTRRTNMPLVGITASGGILTLRIRYEGTAPRQEAERLILETLSVARGKLSDHLFFPPRCLDASGGCLDAFLSSQKTASSLTNQALPNAPGTELLIRTVLDQLIARNQTLATVESCTGGMLGELITAIPGASAAYLGGFVTYANTLKEHLGVDPTTLREHGAVSAPVAQQMADRARQTTNATFALSITGIAGPDGGTPQKPVGTVHIALSESSPEGGASRSSPQGGGMFIAPAMNAEGAAGSTPPESPAKHTGKPDLRRLGDEGPDASRPRRGMPDLSEAKVRVSDKMCVSRHFLFTGDREDIRRRAAISALTILYFRLKGSAPGTPRLLWEITQP